MNRVDFFWKHYFLFFTSRQTDRHLDIFPILSSISFWVFLSLLLIYLIFAVRQTFCLHDVAVPKSPKFLFFPTLARLLSFPEKAAFGNMTLYIFIEDICVYQSVTSFSNIGTSLNRVKYLLVVFLFFTHHSNLKK